MTGLVDDQHDVCICTKHTPKPPTQVPTIIHDKQRHRGKHERWELADDQTFSRPLYDSESAASGGRAKSRGGGTTSFNPIFFWYFSLDSHFVRRHATHTRSLTTNVVDILATLIPRLLFCTQKNYCDEEDRAGLSNRRTRLIECSLGSVQKR